MFLFKFYFFIYSYMKKYNNFINENIDLLLDRKELKLSINSIYNIIYYGSYDNIIKMLTNFDLDLTQKRNVGGIEKSELLYYLLEDVDSLRYDDENIELIKYKKELYHLLNGKYSKQYEKYKKQRKAKTFNL